MNQIVKATIIPAAGLGSRVKDVTKGKSKEMLKYKGKYLIQLAIEESKKYLPQIPIFIVSNKEKMDLNEYLHEKHKDVYVIYQDAPKGLGHAVFVGVEYLTSLMPIDKDSAVNILLPDTVLGTRGLNAFYKPPFPNRVGTHLIPSYAANLYGIVYFNSDGLVSMVEEKPEITPYDRVNKLSGRYLLNCKSLDFILKYYNYNFKFIEFVPDLHSVEVGPDFDAGDPKNWQ